MRLRFALLIAAAVIFAPGWDGQGPPPHPHASDFVARVLAPTVDEGALRDPEADLTEMGSPQMRRWRPADAFEGTASFGIGGLALIIFCLVATRAGSPFDLYQLRHRSSRAPPLLPA
jgi:hypothetical protein